MIDKLVIWNDQNILRAVRVYVAKLRSTHWREASRCTRPIPLRMHPPKRAESKGNISKPKASIQKSGNSERKHRICRMLWSVSPRSASTHVTAA